MLGNRDSLTAKQQWDLVVIGGGITGAGVALEAARCGQRVLLLEQRDFAWGTSSRSSKMVHGGLRYLAQGNIAMTRHSLLEREHLVRALPELVVRADYLFPLKRGRKPGRIAMTLALWLYDRLAGIKQHRYLQVNELAKRVPGLDMQNLKGAMCYTDALTDDTRLVLRILHGACQLGAEAVNYAAVKQVTPLADGGFELSVANYGSEKSETLSLTARQVINATGAWADQLDAAPARIRPLRGSHLFIDPARLPVNDCLTVLHQDDNRPVFIFAWQGVTCVGTTDLDHDEGLHHEPRASSNEIDYLLRLVNQQFPGLNINRDDIWATMAGVRPVISSGKGLDPSKERRDHAIWQEQGVTIVSGGKLTTFRRIALDALNQAGLLDDESYQQQLQHPDALLPPLSAPPGVSAYLTASEQLNGEFIDWVLHHEAIINLDDLMLRRTRLGVLLPNAGKTALLALRKRIQTVLGWSDAKWDSQFQRYMELHTRYYTMPSQSVAGHDAP